MLSVLPKLQVHPKLLTLASRAGDTRAVMDTKESGCFGVPRVEPHRLLEDGTGQSTQHSMDVC